MIHLNNVSDVYRPRYTWVWLLSSFKAGFLNSAGFLATGSFVSHVTGFGTQVGIALGHKDFFFGTEILIIPIAFITGGIVTSFILDRKRNTTLPPPYYLVQVLITSCIALVLIIGESRFGSFSPDTPHPKQYGWFEFIVITLLCFTCGLKNSLLSWATKGKIKVTHLTGLSTDIGLNFLKMLPFKNNSYFSEEEKVANSVRLMMLFSFSIGAASSALLFPQVGYKGFFIALGISLALTAVSIWDRQRRISEVRLPLAKKTFLYEPNRNSSVSNEPLTSQERHVSG